MVVTTLGLAAFTQHKEWCIDIAYTTNNLVSDIDVMLFLKRVIPHINTAYTIFSIEVLYIA